MKIIIITNEPIFSYGLRAQLHSWGFSQVEIVLSCEKALQAIQEPRPALVIMDAKMIQACSADSLALITSLHTIPLTVLSTPNDYNTIPSWIRERNIFYYINKPCHISELKETVEKMLGISIAVA